MKSLANIMKRLFIFSVFLLVACRVNAQETDSLDVFSGSWYDPSHDGEGWIVEVLDDETAVIYWFTYDQQGNQTWLIGIAEQDGNTLNADMLLTSGPVFGADYDPDSLAYEAWGTLSFRIDGCQSGFLEYASPVEGYGSGSLAPQRLVTIDGLNCEQPSTPATSRFSGWSGSCSDRRSSQSVSMCSLWTVPFTKYSGDYP